MPSSHTRPNLIHAQVEFLINHLEGDWRALAEGIRHEGHHAFIYFFLQQLCEDIALIFEEGIIEDEDSDGEWDAEEAALAIEMGIDNFSCDDEEEGATVLDDPDGPRIESEDETMNDDAWIWKSASS